MIAIESLQPTFVTHQEDRKIPWLVIKAVAMTALSEIKRAVASTLDAAHVYGRPPFDLAIAVHLKFVV